MLLYWATSLLLVASHVTQGGASEVWCDPVLGCLELTPAWYSVNRPLNTLPAKRENINTRFMLQTRADPALDKNVFIEADNLTTITSSTFDGSKPVKIIIHGYLDNGNAKWLKELASALLTHGDYNVIRTDWKGGSRTGYTHACANIRVVGLEVGHLVNTMVATYGVDPANVHIIGHSLGSHASGYAGEQIPNLGRISGLDPAGPYYTGTDTFIRLDPSDAQFVDNIHTDADSLITLGLGTAQPMGDLDFYPNGGHDMPGCLFWGRTWDMIMWNLENGLRDTTACNHHRAISYYTESLLGYTCPMVGTECTDYNSFEAGICKTCGSDSSSCAYMGIRADEYTGKGARSLVQLYLDTDAHTPFCYVQYDVEILTAYPSNAEETVVGHIMVTLYGSDGGIIDSLQITDKHERIDHGSVLRFPFSTHEEIGDVLRVELKWKYDDTLNPGTYCTVGFCNKSLYVQSINIIPFSACSESDRTSKSFLGCSATLETTEIHSGDTAVFSSSSSCQPIP